VELLKQLIPMLLTVSLALLVVAVGLGSAKGDLLYVIRRPALLARGLIAVSLIPVLAAIAVIAVFPVSHASKVAIMLMAISPVPPLVPGKMLKFGGRTEYAYGLYTAMALLAVFTVPVWGVLLNLYYGVHASFPSPIIASNIFLGVVLPLAIGLLLGRWLAPRFAERAAPIIAKVGMGLVVLAFIPIIIKVWPAVIGLIGDGTIVAVMLIVAIMLAGGHVLGGPAMGDRATLAFAAATRHPGIALALVGANHGDEKLTAAVVLFLLVGLVAMVPYQMLVKRRLSAAEQPAV
jgi:predicted Na+-dependent transporter